VPTSRRRRSRWLLAASVIVAAGAAGGVLARVDSGVPAIVRPIALAGIGNTETQRFELGPGLSIVSTSATGRSQTDVSVVNADGQTLPGGLTLLKGETSGSSLAEVAAGQYRLSITTTGPWKVTISQPRPRTARGMPATLSGKGSEVVGPIQLPGEIDVSVDAFDGSYAVTNAVVFTLAGFSKTSGLDCPEGSATLFPEAGPNYVAVSTYSPNISWTIMVGPITPSPFVQSMNCG
jgi:hypothetical protein